MQSIVRSVGREGGTNEEEERSPTGILLLLIASYLFSGEPLPRAGKEPGELGELRSTLLLFLRDSRCYQPQNLLTHFPDSK